MRTPGTLSLLVALGALLGLGGCGAPGVPRPRHVTVFATGFMRGQVDDFERSRGMGHVQARYFGGAGRMNTLMNELREARRLQGHRVLTFDVGDFLAGSPEAAATRGGSSMAIMVTRGYDAVLLGNRELNFGTERLLELQGGAGRPLQLPLVTTNVHLEKVSPSVFGSEGGRRRPPAFARAVRELEVPDGDLRVRVLGFTPPNLSELVEPENLQGLAVEPDLERVLRMHAPDLEGDGELTVLLTQADVFARRDELVAAVRGSGVDLVLGHAYGKGAVAYQQEGCWFAGVRNDLPGAALVEWNLSVDPESGHILSLVEHYNVTLGRRPGRDYLEVDPGPERHARLDLEEVIPPDKALLEALSPYRKQLARLDQVLATTAVDLTGAYEEESTLGNLVADALRAADPEAEVALVSAGVVGHNRIHAGDILRRDLGKMFPYSNQLERLSATGAQLRRALAGMVSRRIHVLLSGVAYDYRDSGAEARLLEVRVGGAPLDDGRRYRVVVNSFAHRRDPVLRDLPTEALGDCQELLADYLLRTKQVAPRLEGRLRRNP